MLEQVCPGTPAYAFRMSNVLRIWHMRGVFEDMLLYGGVPLARAEGEAAGGHVLRRGGSGIFTPAFQARALAITQLSNCDNTVCDDLYEVWYLFASHLWPSILRLYLCSSSSLLASSRPHGDLGVFQDVTISLADIFRISRSRVTRYSVCFL